MTAPEWSAPTPLENAVERPPFPTDSLPPALGRWAIAQAKALQVPVDHAAMLALAATAAAVAGRWKIEARPGWVEPLNVYVATVASSGERKSAIASAAVRPIQAREAAERQSYNQRVAVLRESDDETDAKALRELEAKGPPRLLADDITPERLAALMSENGDRMAIINAEGGGFFEGLGRYTNNGPNVELALKAHAGESVHVDRRLNKEAIVIESATLTLGLAVQPDVIRGLAGKPSFRGRGLIARFLFSLPTSCVGQRQIAPPAAATDVVAEYERTLSRLLDTPAPLFETPTIRLSPKAADTLIQFETELEPRLGTDGDLGPIADWGGKLAGAVLRLAGILHLARTHSEDIENSEEVTAREMGAAVEIGRYLIQHARAAFDLIGEDPALEGARLILQWIRKRGWTSFTQRDLHQTVRGAQRFKNAGAIEEPLRTLVAHGFIRPLARESGQVGRPSVTFEVHPHAHNAQYPQNGCAA